MPAGEPAVLLTCEHADRRVPARWRACLRGAARARAGHRGWDPGALPVARAMARAHGWPLIAHRTTRLLVEVNRSEDHPALWSEWTRGLSDIDKERILRAHYRPHRARVEAAVRRAGRTVHVGVHSFTPVWRGRTRAVDVGLLFDPRREAEARLAAAWRDALRRLRPGLRVRRNLPYRGWTDGLVTHLRGRLPARRYLGFELELNQARVARDGPERDALAGAVGAALVEALSALRSGGARSSRSARHRPRR